MSITNTQPRAGQFTDHNRIRLYSDGSFDIEKGDQPDDLNKWLINLEDPIHYPPYSLGGTNVNLIDVLEEDKWLCVQNADLRAELKRLEAQVEELKTKYKETRTKYKDTRLKLFFEETRIEALELDLKNSEEGKDLLRSLLNHYRATQVH